MVPKHIFAGFQLYVYGVLYLLYVLHVRPYPDVLRRQIYVWIGEKRCQGVSQATASIGPITEISAGMKCGDF